jgi:tetratricopeptide (TPR) repeat protein
MSMTDSTPLEPDSSIESSSSLTNVSGGVNVDAQRDVNIGGDVVGRDKIIVNYYFPASQVPLQAEAQNRLRVLFVDPRPLRSNMPLRNPEAEWLFVSNTIERKRSPFALVRLVPPTFLELQDALADLRHPYDIIHIVGGDADNGLYLEHENGYPDFYTVDQLTAAFRRAKAQLVILNIGKAQMLAEALRSVDGLAILASTDSVTNIEAEIVLNAFYGGLSNQQSLHDAYQMGKDSFAHEQQGHECQFVLLADRDDQPLRFPDDLATLPKIFSGRPPHNPLPALTSDFVDRESMLTDTLFNWFSVVSPIPVMALTGLGGIGKRALSIAACERYGWQFPGGIFYLSAPDTPDFSPQHIAETMDMALGTQMMKSDNPSSEALQYLEAKRCLLILNRVDSLNDDQQQALARWLEMLSRQMGSRVLMTMRPDSLEAFRSLEITCRQVNQLDLSAACHLLQLLAGQPDSAAMQHLQGHYSEVAQAAFCHPFLLRIAASMLEVSPLNVVLNRFHKLRGGSLTKGITQLLGEMVTSVARRSPGAERLLCTLAVFRNGASREALEEVHGETADDFDEMLDGLAIENLIELDPKTDRYSATSLIVEWASRWGSYSEADWANAHRRHVRCCLNYARQYSKIDRPRWTELDVDWENVRAAANWITKRVVQEAPSEEDAALAVDFVRALDEVIISARRPSESEVWLQAGQTACRNLKRTADEGWFTLKWGLLDVDRGNLEHARECFEQCAELFANVDDRKGMRYAYGNLGHWYHTQGNYDQAVIHYQQVTDLCRADDDVYGTIVGHVNLGDVFREMGDAAKAEVNLNESVRLCRESNKYPFFLAIALGNLAELRLASNDIDQAFSYATESWASAKELQVEDQMGVASRILGDIWERRGDAEQAIHFWKSAIQLLTEADVQEELAEAHENLGRFLVRSDSVSEAREHLTMACQIYESLGDEGRAANVRNILPLPTANQEVPHDN